MRMRSLLLFFVFLLTDACVDPLKVPNLAVEQGLVVDGAITDQPGPYTVQLFSAQSLDKDLDKRQYVGGAAVTISDDHGHTVTLTENATGTYQTDAIQGVVGHTYQLGITLEDGRQYESTPVLLEPAGTVDRVFFQFQENSINQNDLTKPQDAFAVYVDATGTPGASNLFRWRWKGIFHYIAFPELRTRGVGRTEIPDPPLCSGWIYTDSTGLDQVGPCECCDCWAPQYSTDALVSENDFINEMEFKTVRVAQIPIDKRLFYEKYHIEVEQMSVSQDIYAFWKLVKAQQQSASDIFQPAVVKIKGTIRCTSDPDEKAYGIFSASAVTKSSVFIRRLDIPKAIPQIDTLKTDCRTIYPGATNQRPPFW
ncbi:DUF4249 domain-containing protein [Dawidia soli]|uniref:DUF4249 family protein n=1 Tax=Dawidia soli TaxID=2782352 RepID=A0AAP2DGC0_9BACT|nr:DUF4249 domain-containing protein [Dawidia soli]MBT1688842.1 DUF4249 family protein [Dawidia soli]